MCFAVAHSWIFFQFASNVKFAINKKFVPTEISFIRYFTAINALFLVSFSSPLFYPRYLFPSAVNSWEKAPTRARGLRERMRGSSSGKEKERQTIFCTFVYIRKNWKLGMFRSRTIHRSLFQTLELASFPAWCFSFLATPVFLSEWYFAT